LHGTMVAYLLCLQGPRAGTPSQTCLGWLDSSWLHIHICQCVLQRPRTTLEIATWASQIAPKSQFQAHVAYHLFADDNWNVGVFQLPRFLRQLCRISPGIDNEHRWGGPRSFYLHLWPNWCESGPYRTLPGHPRCLQAPPDPTAYSIWLKTKKDASEDPGAIAPPTLQRSPVAGKPVPPSIWPTKCTSAMRQTKRGSERFFPTDENSSLVLSRRAFQQQL
jgi:hypothetical protein